MTMQLMIGVLALLGQTNEGSLTPPPADALSRPRPYEHVTSAAIDTISRNGSRFFAHGDLGGGWDRYDIPGKAKGQVVQTAFVATLELEGEEIVELAAFSPHRGRWCTIPLKQPVNGRIEPIVSSDMAVVHVDGWAYAFSPKQGTWDVVECHVSPAASIGAVRIFEEDRFAIFRLESGRWDVLDKSSFED